MTETGVMRGFSFALKLAVLFAAVLAMTGCATTEERQDPNQVSQIPWNRPEKWEGGGAMGSYFNTQ